MFLKTIVFVACLGAASAADLGRGIELYKQGNYAGANSELTAVVEGQPDDAPSLRYLGLARVELKKADEARGPLQHAFDVDPSGESRLALARLYVEEKDYAKAEEMLKEASGDELDYVRGLLALNRKQNQEAVNKLESFLEANPDHAYAHYYLGLAYNALKRPDRMMSHFDMFVKLKPDAPEARKVRSVLNTGR